MIVKKVWLPRKTIYTVRDSMDPSDPTVGSVTYTRAGSEQEKQQEARDYDQERSTQAIKFDVPEDKGAVKQQKPPELEAEVTPELRLFLLSAALCNLSTVRYDEAEEGWKTTGEPTEIALHVFAHRFKLGKKPLEAAGWTQVAVPSSPGPIQSLAPRMPR